MDTTQELATEPTLNEVWDTFSLDQQSAVMTLASLKASGLPIRQRVNQLRNTLNPLQQIALDFLIRGAPPQGRLR